MPACAGCKGLRCISGGGTRGLPGPLSPRRGAFHNAQPESSRVCARARGDKAHPAAATHAGWHPEALGGGPPSEEGPELADRNVPGSFSGPASALTACGARLLVAGCGWCAAAPALLAAGGRERILPEPARRMIGSGTSTCRWNRGQGSKRDAQLRPRSRVISGA